MALRANSDSSAGGSHISGLPLYWNEHSLQPVLEWDRWLELFKVACMAKHSISVEELTRTSGGARDKALMGNMEEIPAQRKVVSVLYLALGQAARKTLTDKYPTATIATISLANLLTHCKDSFDRPRNQTLDRYKFLTRKQHEGETLQVFWNNLSGLAAHCNFAGLTESLVSDVFIVNMNNKAVQQ